MNQEYQWDPVKARSNYRKHGIRFADAITAFSDELAITIDDDHPDEERFILLGIDASLRLLVIVYTWRDDEIRLISARKAVRHERRQYEA